MSQYKGKYVFSFNKKRNGWEIPGGHIEEGETWIEAAKHEMYEETGTTKIHVEPICVYKISAFALLCYCENLEMDELPKEYKMDKIMLSEDLPDNLTFSETYKLYLDIVKESKNLN